MPEHDLNRFPPEIAHRRDQILAAIMTTGRRRRYRRRAAVVTAAAMAASLTVFAIVDSASGTGRTQVVAAGPDTPAACLSSATPTGTDARQGAGLAFGWLPTGFKVVPSAPFTGYVPGYVGVSATPTGRVVNGQPMISASYEVTSTPVSVLFAPSGAKPGGSYPSVTIAGHPGQLFIPAPGEQSDPTVTWEPVPDVEVTLDNGAGLSQSEMLRVANGVRFSPGTTLAPVGDLGPVMPRSEAVAIAENGSFGTAQDSSATHTLARITAETWLVTPAELTAAHIFPDPNGPPDQPDVLNVEFAAETPTTPLWVVALLVDNTHWNLVAIDAVNGQEIDGTTTGLQGLPLPASVASLTDHAALAPCPDSSPHPADLPSAHLPSQCSLNQLAASYEGQDDISGRLELIVALHNTSQQACGLQGSPYEVHIHSADNDIPAGGAEIPLPVTSLVDPVVTLEPGSSEPPVTVTDPAQLPPGTAWIGLIPQDPGTPACVAVPASAITLSLPFSAAMPDGDNGIPALAVTSHPADVSSCGYAAGVFRAP